MKLRDLHTYGTIELRRDPERHQAGEGTYMFQGRQISIRTEVLGEGPGKDPISFDRPHDVAWDSETQTLLAYAPSITEAFNEQERPGQGGMDEDV